MKKSAWRNIRCGEILLKRLSIVFVVALILAQSLLFREDARPYLSRVDAYEGSQIAFQVPLYAVKPLKITETAEVGRLQLLRSSKTLTIRMIEPVKSDAVFVTVNGKVMDDFHKGTVKLTVYDGDYVEIDAGRQPVVARFVVHVPDNALAAPMDGLAVEGSGIIAIGKVKFRN